MSKSSKFRTASYGQKEKNIVFTDILAGFTFNNTKNSDVKNIVVATY